LLFLIGLLFGAFKAPRADAADWQFSVPVESVTSSENNDHPRAFLWIPPYCQRVRGVVVGQHNMQEEPIFEHPKFRAALSELGFAEIWITPAIDLFFRFDKGAGAHFDAMMTALAQESGYSELQWAPIVPIGHSAAASYPWNYAALHPERTLAVLSVSGQWPYYKDANTPDWGNRTVDGVPGLVVKGEYEDAVGFANEGLKERAAHPQMPLSMLQEPGAGHFDATDAKVEYLALYLKKAVQYRLPANAPLDGPVPLKPIDPTKQGWLADRWRKDQRPTAPAAPVGQYAGNANDAFWFFDEEMAKATEQLEATYRGKKADLLGYVQDGQVIGQNPKTHQQVTLKFLPVDDGSTFKLTGAFLDTVPPGRPEGWTGLTAGSPVSHAAGGGPVVINRICGPVEKLSDDTFAIRFYRMGMNNAKRSSDIWLVATHPGDEQYRRAAQQSELRFPLQNKDGADQTISFPEIPNQQAGATSLKLNATSSAGAAIHYYVLSGPAEIEGDTLRITSVPPRSKWPVKVTVVAWQWGRSIEPKLKTATPVERTFFIVKPGQSTPSAQQLQKEKAERSALWASATAAAKAVVQSNIPTVTSGIVISDNFNSNTPLVDRTPEPTNATANAWQQNGKGRVNATWAEKARIASGVGDGIALGKYSAATKLTLSMTFNLGRMTGDQAAGPLTRGAGLGFFTALDANAAQGSDHFTGVGIDRAGNVRLIVDGQGTSTFVSADNFDPNVDHVLSYTVDTKTGTITNARLDDNAGTFTVPANTFTASRMAYAGFYVSGAGERDEAAIDSFSVEVGGAPATPTELKPNTQAGTGNAVGFNVCKSLEMRPTDLAGAEARHGNWNNLDDVKVGAPVTLTHVVDRDGKAVPNLTVTISAGSPASNANTFDGKTDAGATTNDTRLYNGVFDQKEGAPTTITISGIPFAHYDVFFYRSDDGPARAGEFHVGDKVLYLRGGKGNPTDSGSNYVRSSDTTLGDGTDIEQGNYVKFENLTGDTLQVGFTAVNAGDNVQRCKVVGFQIVERK
jgi:hypothetical protein